MAKKQDKKEYKNAPPLSTLTNWLDFATEASRKKHWEFFVIDQFIRGNHNIRGNPQDNTIEVSKRTENINFPINKMYSTFRAVRNFVTRHKPKIDVDPVDGTPAAADYARRSNKVLERDNQLNNGRRLNKEWVYYGVKYGIGWRQVGYDKEKKVSVRWTIDPFDLLVGSKTGKAEDAPYLIKVLNRTVGYWKNKYPDCNVVADNEIAWDQYKKLSLQIIYQDTTTSSNGSDEQTALGFECWYKVFDKNKMGGYINKCLFTMSEIVNFEETPFDDYPFIPYEAEIMPNEVYPEGHMKNVIAPQRMLNLLNTQMLEYNHIVNKGRILKDKNAGFRVINAKEGQIIEKNPGKMVQVLNPPAVNPLLQWQIGFAGEQIEDIGGQHDASVGATPERVTSGAAIESLQQGDSNNLSDLRDNFEDALSTEAAWILKMYSLFEDEGFVLSEDKKPGEQESKQFGVVGQAAYSASSKALPTNPETGKESYFMEDNGTYTDALAILPDNNVKVSVTSELGETKQARLDLLKELVGLGLPLKVLLDHIEFPNTDDIMQRIAEEMLAETQMNQLNAQATQPPPPPGGMPPPNGGPPPNGSPASPPGPSGPEDQQTIDQIHQVLGAMSNG